MELSEVIQILTDLADMPVFQRNDAKEYTALMTAIEILSAQVPEPVLCQHYSEKETTFPCFANGTLEMKKAVRGICAHTNDFCTCRGDMNNCSNKN